MTTTADVHPVDQMLPAPRLLALGLQHVLVMYAGAVAVPLIIGRALKLPPEDVAFLISADLFACGLWADAVVRVPLDNPSNKVVIPLAFVELKKEAAQGEPPSPPDGRKEPPKKDDKPGVVVKVDVEGLGDRIVQLGCKAGEYTGAQALGSSRWRPATGGVGRSRRALQ